MNTMEKVLRGLCTEKRITLSRAMDEVLADGTLTEEEALELLPWTSLKQFVKLLKLMGPEFTRKWAPGMVEDEEEKTRILMGRE